MERKLQLYVYFLIFSKKYLEENLFFVDFRYLSKMLNLEAMSFAKFHAPENHSLDICGVFFAKINVQDDVYSISVLNLPYLINIILKYNLEKKTPYLF